MNVDRMLGIAGLLMNAAGVMIAWRWGWPQPDLEGHAGIGLEDGTWLADEGMTAGEYRTRAARRRSRVRGLSALAALLMVAGFGLQLAALLAAP